MWRWLVILAVGCGAASRDAAPAPTSGPVAARAEAAVDGDETRATTPVQIVTGSIAVTVDAYGPARDALVGWVAAHGGHLADESSSAVDGRASYGSVTIRVPVDQVEALVSWVQENDAVDRLDVHRQDVTEQWVDLDARLTAMKATEARLLALTEDRAASLADVLAAEQELARVQGDLESLEVRQRVLHDQVAMATLTVSMSVRTPFSPLVEETLGHEVGRTFAGSVRALVVVARGALLAGVALVPWVGALAALAGGAFGVIRVALRLTHRR